MIGPQPCCRFYTDSISVNSLPESVQVLVNHRIAVQDSVQAVKAHYLRLLQPWADQRRFRLNAFGSVLPPKRPMPRSEHDLEGGTLILEAQYELDSSPVSDAEDGRFGWLVGTLRGVFGDDVVVAPELLTGKSCQLPHDSSQSLIEPQVILIRDTTGICQRKFTECHHGGRVTTLEERGCTLSTRECRSKGLWRW